MGRPQGMFGDVGVTGRLAFLPFGWRSAPSCFLFLPGCCHLCEAVWRASSERTLKGIKQDLDGEVLEVIKQRKDP